METSSGASLLIMGKDFSVVTTVYNEKNSLKQLYEEITAVVDKLSPDYEIIFVNDGSNDGSLEILRELEGVDKRVKVIHFSKNLGKTLALSAAFKKARGNLIVTIDSDLQDDPRDIPILIQKLNEGYDFVCGWRYRRRTILLKSILSGVFNIVVSLTSGIKLHDINCGLKAFKREIVSNIKLYSGLHRYIPILVYLKGFKITEIKINNRIRKYGSSKYGFSRYIIAVIDLFRIITLHKQYENKSNYWNWKSNNQSKNP